MVKIKSKTLVKMKTTNKSIRSQQRQHQNKRSQLKKEKIAKIKSNRIRKKLIKIQRKMPDIFLFKKGSKFIYDFNDSDSIIYKISNPNKLKKNKGELEFLTESIFILKSKTTENTSQFIYIEKPKFESICKYNKMKFKRSELESFILDKISNAKDRSKITCRNIAELYTQETGKVVHKTKVNNIMRNKLGLHYIKTSIKTTKILNIKNLLISFFFIKTIMRAIKMGYKILFQDECSILCSNNNFHCWRFRNEHIFFGDGKKNRKNLLFLIGEEVVYYSINNENTNENNFVEFMEGCANSLKEKQYNDYIIVMDNYSVHKTKKLIEFYRENEINIIFNCPYSSYFNSVELAFRAIKKVLYKKLFNDMNEVVIEVITILSANTFKTTLIKNYKETLEQYLKFCEDNKYIIFNKDDILEN